MLYWLNDRPECPEVADFFYFCLITSNILNKLIDPEISNLLCKRCGQIMYIYASDVLELDKTLWFAHNIISSGLKDLLKIISYCFKLGINSLFVITLSPSPALMTGIIIEVNDYNSGLPPCWLCTCIFILLILIHACDTWMVCWAQWVVVGSYPGFPFGSVGSSYNNYGYKNWTHLKAWNVILTWHCKIWIGLIRPWSVDL